MSDDNFSFSIPPGGAPASGGRAKRHIAPPFDARMADAGQALLLIHGDDRIRRLPLQVVQVFGQCNRFRTLDDHAREITRALRVPPPQAGAIRQALNELTRQELLLTEADLLQRLTSRAPQPSATAISHLFIRTCGRPDTLDRLLDSLRRRSLPDGLSSVVVLDDDDDEHRRGRTRSVVDRHREYFPGRLRLIDPPARRVILDRIARQAGVDMDRLRWSIEGDPDSSEVSYGANLNFALLLGAGRLIAMVDDDATLDAFALPGCGEGPVLRRRQSARLHFPEPDAELGDGDCTALVAHPVDLHARLLGAGVDRLVELAGGETSQMLEDLDPQLLSELSGNSRVRLTSSGTLGDPGTGGLQWLFVEAPEHLQPLCESEERYRALVGQRRMARSAGRPEVTTAFALMTTTMTGIDNRDLLLPTQPRGANEDLLFGALVGFLYPDACQASLPHMLFHMRPQPRRWDASDLDHPRGINRGGFLTARLHALRSRVPAGNVESRMHVLSGALETMAGTDRHELAWQLRQELLEVRSQMIEQVQSTREALDPPPWLDRDFSRVIERHGQIDESQVQRLDAIADELPAFLRRYTGALPDWKTAWQYCRDQGLDDILESHA